MRKHLTAALLFLILTLLLTNPLALHLWNAVQDRQDALLNTWILAWVGHALVTDPLQLYNANIFYPYPNTLAFSEILLPPSLLALPFTLATNNPIFGYNLALLGMLWLDAFGMYLLVYEWTRRAEAGWIAGAIYAFNPFNLGNLAQLQLVTLGCLPLSILFLHKLCTLRDSPPDRSRAVRYGFLFVFFFILQALSSFYYALLAGFAVALYMFWWFVRNRRDSVSARRVAFALGASFLLIAVVLVPFLAPYLQVQRELGFQRRVEESEPFSAALKQFAEVAPENVVYGKFLAPNPVVRVGGYPLDNLFPGIIALALATVGAFAYRRARVRSYLLLLLIGAFVLALGPRLYLTSQQATEIVLPYRLLYDIFPALRALRAPVRFDALINFALAALAGLGAAALLERFRMPRASLVALGIVALVVVEYLALPAAKVVPLPVADEIPDIYKWLAKQSPGVVLELPMMGSNVQDGLDLSTQYFSTYHWKETPDGYSGFIPPRRGEIAYEMETFPSARSVALLRALDVDYVVDHKAGEGCATFLEGIGTVSPPDVLYFDKACIYRIPPREASSPNFEKWLFIPSSVAPAAPFDAYLVLVDPSSEPIAVEPTDRVAAEAHWTDNRIEAVSFPLPLVTSSASVVPIRLTAPSRVGEFQVRLQTLDPLIGATEIEMPVHVGYETANQVVLAASVRLREPLQKQVARGGVLPVMLAWLPHNKVNAYYSASVRLVDEQGNKVSNVDRQPVIPTLLWRPESIVEDVFELPIPPDSPPGNYRVELLLYQADTDEDALLLDGEFKPQPVTVLGEIEIK